MKDIRTDRSWHPVAQCLLGVAVLALITLVAFRLGASTATAVLLYLFVIVLMSLWANFVPAALVSIVAVLSLQYFFVPPGFSFRTGDPLDALALLGFLTTALVITRLMSTVRNSLQEVRALKDQFRRVIDTVPALAWSARPDGGRDFVSQRWLEYTGFSARDALGWDWTAAVHPDDRTRHIELWKTALAAGEPFETEARLRRVDGIHRWFLVRAVALRDELGRISKWYGTATDIEDRKLAEAKLVRSEEQWKDVFENNPTMYFIVDAAGSTLSVNPFGAEQLGYTPAELVGRSVLHVFHEADRKAVQAHLTRCLELHGQTTNWEIRKVRKDGTVIWVRETAKAARRGEDQPIVLIAGEDITDRKHAEQALREQASLLDLTHDSLFVRDMNDVITYWNRGAEELYQWKREEALGKVTHQLLQTIFPQPLEEITVQLVQTGRWSGELIHMKRNGTSAVVASRWSLQRDEHGLPIATLETNNDITERKRAEEAVARQANLLEQTHDAVFVWEFPRTITYWNRGAEQLYGYSREEAIGRSSHELLQTQHPIPAALFEAALERHGEWTGELTQSTRDGRKIIVESRHVLVREVDGHRLVLETNRDITERRQAEDAMRKAQADLTHVARITTMGEMAASIAHEVNQPLSGVVINANASLRWLASGSPNLDEARDALQRIIRDGKRASDVIARIRALSKKTTGEKEPLDLNEAILEVVGLAQGELRRTHVALRTELANDLPHVLGDRVQLQQVVLNLVLNATEAMSSLVDRPRHLVIRTQRDEADRVRTSVQDSGVGLDPQNVNRIFDAFYTTKQGGMGMGLSISRSIIENHGGRLWVVPNEGPGTTFQFTV